MAGERAAARPALLEGPPLDRRRHRAEPWGAQQPRAAPSGQQRRRGSVGAQLKNWPSRRRLRGKGGPGAEEARGARRRAPFVSAAPRSERGARALLQDGRHLYKIYPPPRSTRTLQPQTAEDEAEYDAAQDQHEVQDGAQKLEDPSAVLLQSFCRTWACSCVKIVRYDSSGDLHPEYGSYLPDEYPDGTKALGYKKHPDAVFVIENVQPDLVSVDMNNNYGSHTPRFIFGITVIQVAVFVHYVFYLGADQYEAGPELWWMKTIDVFPKCGDLRGQYWRLLSYQLVHSGFEHIIFNALMQCLFGLINMVHGDLKFFVMYELGVIGGSMNWVLIDGGQGGLVGASGGVTPCSVLMRRRLL